MKPHLPSDLKNQNHLTASASSPPLPDTIEATLAFVFSRDLQQVLLIKKQKPIHHAGKLNGLGGKLEANETHRECMSREIVEEADLTIRPEAWQAVGRMSWSIWRVSIWTYVIDTNTLPAFSDTNVSWYSVSALPQNVIENLFWIIPLCVDINQKVIHLESALPMIDIVYSD